MNAKQAYALSKKYTSDTAEEFGAVKGANCTVKSIVHQNGINIVTFEWKNSQGATQESQMIVYDGTPIYVWEPGNTYHFGDLVIYASAFYRCIVENSDAEFDDTKWNEIGSPDGNYDIVQNPELLPPRFTSADRKLYYSISDDMFYLWDGTAWLKRQQSRIQFDVMPQASASFVGKVYQYVGATDVFTKGHFYECINDDGSYIWRDTVSTAAGRGVDVTPTQNSQNLPESGGVYAALADKVNVEQGKGLSTNDYDNTAKGIVDGVTSALALKVDKEQGKGLSTNDYDNAEKTKVTGAQPKTLATPIVVDGVTQTTVEGTLGALNNKTVDVDSAMSSSSENPVQNKVVKAYVDDNTQEVSAATAQQDFEDVFGNVIPADPNNNFASGTSYDTSDVTYLPDDAPNI